MIWYLLSLSDLGDTALTSCPGFPNELQHLNDNTIPLVMTRPKLVHLSLLGQRAVLPSPMMTSN